MNKKFWIFVYLAVLAADLIAIWYNKENLRFVTKPLLMPLLGIYFLTNIRSFTSSLPKWVGFALVFSWLGDLLLMFERLDGRFFIPGLIAFLIAHIFYIIFYERIARLENLKKNYWLFIPVLIYYVALIYLLSPYLADMKLPVRVYGLVISYMLIQALQTGRINDQTAALLMISGAILFIASDSILAINRFYKPFSLAGILVMLTYGTAQLLIANGAVKYISSTSKA